jgi:acyl transferase domain-containing protein
LALGQTTISALDSAERFDPNIFTRGDNASGLIYASAYCDGKNLNDDIEVVAVTGNSMGWYIALALAGAVSEQDGFRLVNTMGDLMQRHLIGGQLVYPITDENWVIDEERQQNILETIARIDAKTGHDLCLSIDLGGLLVLAGNEAGLTAFEAVVPKIMGRFPMRLQNHAAFHSHLQADVAAQGQMQLSDIKVKPPEIPLIDGFGNIWWEDGCDTGKMWDYTLGAQVTETYNFSKAIETAAKEFAPDIFIVAGPGNTLGGAVAQSLIGCGWKGMKNKVDFEVLQAETNFLVSMGRKEQRNLVSS